MGLFSSKKEERKNGNRLDIPMPSGQNIPLPPPSSSSYPSRSRDDFEHSFDMNTPLQAQNRQGDGGASALTPTSLTPSMQIDIGLPSFTTKSDHRIDLDAMEKELSINFEKKDEQVQAFTGVQTDAKQMVPEPMSADGLKEPASQMHAMNQEIDEPNELDEIPDEIEDIPDFIPPLDIEESMLSETAEFIEEPTEAKSAFIDVNSIVKIKRSSNDIKAMLDSINESTMQIIDNDNKQKEVMQRSRSIFEDVERKILFINKTLFSEE